MEERPVELLLCQAELDFLEHGPQSNELVKMALSKSPQHGFAHLLRGFLLLQAGMEALIPAVKKCIAQVEAAPPSPNKHSQARLHRLLPALRAWSNEGMRAGNHALEKALYQNPNDLFVLKLLTLGHFWLGNIKGVCDCSAWVLAHFSDEKAQDHPFAQYVPQRHFVHGMLAFGLEESGALVEAETHAKIAIQANPQDLWGIHALAHVFEAQGRHKEALGELGQYARNWERGGPFAGHLWWHLALHHLEQGAFECVLSLYDDHVRGSTSDFYLDLQNAVSLLWRMELCGVDVSPRWEPLAEDCAQHCENLAVPFTFFHIIPAFMRSGRVDQAQQAIDWLKAQAQNPARNNAAILQDAVLPSCQGLQAYAQQQWSQAQTLLEQACNQMHQAGGSRAQRDVLEQTRICAAMQATNWQQAKTWLAERVVDFPNSVPNWQWQTKTLQALDQTQQAKQAQQQVAKLRYPSANLRLGGI